MSHPVHVEHAPYDVYIGRNSKYGNPKWGNPFSHLENTSAQFKVSSREEAIRRYSEWITTQPHLMSSLPELEHKVLGCHCWPLACHGQVLMKLANGKKLNSTPKSKQHIISVDWESFLFEPGWRAPLAVCLSTFDGTERKLYARKEALLVLERLLLEDSVILSGQNIAFDMALTAANAPHLVNAIFRAYRLKRIRCTKISEQLLDIADGAYTTKEKGRYSLAGMLKRHHSIDISEAKGKKHKFFNPSEDEGQEFYKLLGRFQRISAYLDGVATAQELYLFGELNESDLVRESLLLHERIIQIVGDWNIIPPRIRFAEMAGKKVEDYPEHFFNYAVEDTEYDYLLATGQQERAREAEYTDGEFHVRGGAEQAAYDFAFYLVSCWGFHTDWRKIEAIKGPLQADLEKLNAELETIGFLKMNRSGARKGLYSKDMATIKAAVEKAYEGNPPRNDPTTDDDGVTKQVLNAMSGEMEDVIGSIRTNKETLEESGDPHLEMMAERTGYEDIFVKWIPTLTSGIMVPVHTNYNVLVETGRTSSYDFNSQNQPRKGGIRECFIARTGVKQRLFGRVVKFDYVFCSVDYNSIELKTLAQVCLWLFGEPDENGNYYKPGISLLADAYRMGLDPHKITAANILKLTYEEFEAEFKREKSFLKGRDKPCHDARQLAKALNFGLPGGLGARKFVIFAKTQYGVILTRDEVGKMDMEASIKRARELSRQWFKLYPEVRKYCDIVGEKTPNGWKYQAEQYLPPIQVEELDFVDGEWVKIWKWIRPPGRLRGDCNYNSGCNTYFQGLASDGAKAALFEIVAECYTGYTANGQLSVLYGCRVLAFIHDEIFLELPKDRAHECAMRVQFVMESVMQRFVPDIKVAAEPALCEWWDKGMEPLWKDTQGQIWDKAKADAAGIQVFLSPWYPQK